MAINIDSVLAQTDQDVEQIFIVDDCRRGRPWANKELARHRDKVGMSGEGYTYILDDDCMLINPHFVERLRPFVKERDYPQGVMVRSRRPQLRIKNLPTPEVWGRADRIKVKTTNCLCYVIRNDWYWQYIYRFGTKSAGDWNFLSAMLRQGIELEWLDILVGETQQLGRGRRFEPCGSDWFAKVAQEYSIQELAPGDWRLRLWQAL